MLLRILASIALLFSILYMPLWLSALIAILAMVYFSFFWEGVVLFFLLDLLYGVGESRYLGVFFVSFIVSLAVFLVIELIKKKVRVSE